MELMLNPPLAIRWAEDMRGPSAVTAPEPLQLRSASKRGSLAPCMCTAPQKAVRERTAFISAPVPVQSRLVEEFLLALPEQM